MLLVLVLLVNRRLYLLVLVAQDLSNALWKHGVVRGDDVDRSVPVNAWPERPNFLIAPTVLYLEHRSHVSHKSTRTLSIPL